MTADGPPPRPPHPLLHVGRELLVDLLSTLAFLAVFEATGRLAVAIGWAMAVAAVQVGHARRRGVPVAPLQWLGLLLILVFGGASLVSGVALLYRLKFTLAYLATGAVTLAPGWMDRYVSPAALAHAGDVNTAFGFIWSALFFATAALNLCLALLFTPAVWAWFIGVFPLATKLGLVAVQYAVTRRVVRRRRAAAASPANPDDRRDQRHRP